MIELMIERWNNLDGSADHFWSIWHDGKRLRFGRRHPDAEAAEAEALAFCRQAMGREPDRITRL